MTPPNRNNNSNRNRTNRGSTTSRGSTDSDGNNSNTNNDGETSSNSPFHRLPWRAWSLPTIHNGALLLPPLPRRQQNLQRTGVGHEGQRQLGGSSPELVSMAALNLNNGNVDGLFHPYYQHNEVNRMNSVFEIIDRVFEVIGNDGDDNDNNEGSDFED